MNCTTAHLISWYIPWASSFGRVSWSPSSFWWRRRLVPCAPAPPPFSFPFHPKQRKWTQISDYLDTWQNGRYLFVGMGGKRLDWDERTKLILSRDRRAWRLANMVAGLELIESRFGWKDRTRDVNCSKTISCLLTDFERLVELFDLEDIPLLAVHSRWVFWAVCFFWAKKCVKFCRTRRTQLPLNCMLSTFSRTFRFLSQWQKFARRTKVIAQEFAGKNRNWR